jgi:hypothetical protein
MQGRIGAIIQKYIKVHTLYNVHMFKKSPGNGAGLT